MTRVMWVALALLGCSGHAPATVVPIATHAPLDASSPSPAADATRPLDQDLARLAERTLVLYRDIASAFAVADCGAAATRLHELHDANADVISASTKVMHDGRAAQLRAALQAHDDDFEVAAKAIAQSPALAHCHGDETFAHAFDELVGSPP